MSMLAAGFEPTIPAVKRFQAYALDRTVHRTYYYGQIKKDEEG
jgi:hypothetical protein